MAELTALAPGAGPRVPALALRDRRHCHPNVLGAARMKRGTAAWQWVVAAAFLCDVAEQRTLG